MSAELRPEKAVVAPARRRSRRSQLTGRSRRLPGTTMLSSAPAPRQSLANGLLFTTRPSGRQAGASGGSEKCLKSAAVTSGRAPPPPARPHPCPPSPASPSPAAPAAGRHLHHHAPGAGRHWRLALWVRRRREAGPGGHPEGPGSGRARDARGRAAQAARAARAGVRGPGEPVCCFGGLLCACLALFGRWLGRRRGGAGAGSLACTLQMPILPLPLLCHRAWARCRPGPPWTLTSSCCPSRRTRVATKLSWLRARLEPSEAPPSAQTPAAAARFPRQRQPLLALTALSSRTPQFSPQQLQIPPHCPIPTAFHSFLRPLLFLQSKAAPMAKRAGQGRGRARGPRVSQVIRSVGWGVGQRIRGGTGRDGDEGRVSTGLLGEAGRRWYKGWWQGRRSLAALLHRTRPALTAAAGCCAEAPPPPGSMAASIPRWYSET